MGAGALGRGLPRGTGEGERAATGGCARHASGADRANLGKRYEYLFEAEKPSWLPEYDERSKLVLNPPKLPMVPGLHDLEPEDWTLVRGLRPADEGSNEGRSVLELRALEESRPDSGNYVLYARRRRLLEGKPKMRDNRGNWVAFSGEPANSAGEAVLSEPRRCSSGPQKWLPSRHGFRTPPLSSPRIKDLGELFVARDRTPVESTNISCSSRSGVITGETGCPYPRAPAVTQGSVAGARTGQSDHPFRSMPITCSDAT